jgi:hypothetical protein
MVRLRAWGGCLSAALFWSMAPISAAPAIAGDPRVEFDVGYTAECRDVHGHLLATVGKPASSAGMMRRRSWFAGMTGSADLVLRQRIDFFLHRRELVLHRLKVILGRGLRRGGI